VGNNKEIVKRMNKSQSHLCRQPVAVHLSFRIMITHKHNLRIENSHCFNLDVWRSLKHHDYGAYSKMLCKKCDALRVIPDARRDDSNSSLRLCKTSDAVIRSANFKAEHGLLIFALE